MHRALRSTAAGLLLSVGIGCSGPNLTMTWSGGGCGSQETRDASRIEGFSAVKVYTKALEVAQERGAIRLADGLGQIRVEVDGHLVDIRVKRTTGQAVWLTVKERVPLDTEPLQRVGRRIHDEICRQLGVPTISESQAGIRQDLEETQHDLETTQSNIQQMQAEIR